MIDRPLAGLLLQYNRKRVIGATPEAMSCAESELGFILPPSFRERVLHHNGRWVEDVGIFPIFNARDPRKTWDSIVRQNDHGRWFENCFERTNLTVEKLLTFGASGAGDYYCCDYSRIGANGEVPVVLLSHETAERDDRANTFAAFIEQVQRDLISD